MNKVLDRIFRMGPRPPPPPPPPPKERRTRERVEREKNNITAQFATALGALESTASKASDVAKLSHQLVCESEKLKNKLDSRCPHGK